MTPVTPCPLRALLITPERMPSSRGNAITVDRIATALTERGLELRVCTPAELDLLAPRPEPPPQVLHAFNARLSGTPARTLASAWRAALVITITGTDANVDLANPAHVKEVLNNLGAARVITVFHRSIGELLTAADPSLSARVRVIPQSPHLIPRPWDFRARHGIQRTATVLFLPGGLRPVKDTLMPFAPFRRLRARHPDLCLAIAGPRLDTAYAARVDAEVARTPGAVNVGEIPHDAMYGAIVASDLVLNTSQSEGGMANTLLEAMTTDTPVLARRIAGNLSLVTEGVTGMTFESDAEFEAQVERFLAEPHEAKGMAQTAREAVARTYRREAEAEAYELAYREAIAG